MKRFKVIFCSVLLLIVGGCLTFIAFSRPHGSPAVTVSFVGFTNDTAGTRLAAFAISNASPWAVARGGHYRVQLPAGRRWTNLAENWFPSGGSTLGVGSSEVVTLTAPTNQGAWRLAITARKEEGVVFGMATELLIEGQKLGLPTRYQRVSHSIHSDMIQE